MLNSDESKLENKVPIEWEYVLFCAVPVLRLCVCLNIIIALHFDFNFIWLMTILFDSVSREVTRRVNLLNDWICFLTLFSSFFYYLFLIDSIVFSYSLFEIKVILSADQCRAIDSILKSMKNTVQLFALKFADNSSLSWFKCKELKLYKKDLANIFSITHRYQHIRKIN